MKLHGDGDRAYTTYVPDASFDSITFSEASAGMLSDSNSGRRLSVRRPAALTGSCGVVAHAQVEQRAHVLIGHAGKPVLHGCRARRQFASLLLVRSNASRPAQAHGRLLPRRTCARCGVLARAAEQREQLPVE